MINFIDEENVKLLPGLFYDRLKINREYLMSLKSQCLLQNYYIEAGLNVWGLGVIENPQTANLHWGWESPTCQLRGHFLGHWLSAASMIIAQNNDTELKAKLDNIVEELEKCQKANGGKWVGPFPEKYFTMLEKGENVWSPQYTIHKLIMGLIDANIYTGNKKALTIVNNLADWFVKWTDKVSKSENPEAIYSGEQGGMIEVWAELFRLTQKPKYENLMQKYMNPSIFADLLEGKDPLSNAHQNASIPFIQGAAKLYEITGEKKYYDILEKFWDCAVINRESYCTGAQGAGEFWVAPHNVGQSVGERNQEFCTVYNMVRVADYLFRFTGNAKYIDYIERNLYNGFLAQQNKTTGMPTYFLPMKSGANKKWGSPTNDFWCCHGTMVQAQALYSKLCYYQAENENRIYVAQYIPSEGKFVFEKEDSKNKVTITQNLNMKYYNDTAYFDENDKSQNSRWLLKFSVHADCEFTLSFRIPDWIAARPKVTVNGTEVDVPSNCDKCGFLNVKRVWGDDEVIVYLPSGLRTRTLSDMSEKFALLEGPIVLAGLSDNDYGIKFPSGNEKVFRPVKEHTYSSFPWLQSNYKTVNQDRETTFIPLYDVTDEKYTLYWTKK